MKILEHLVTDPAAHEADCVRVNVTHKEGHIPTVSKVTGISVGAGYSKAVVDSITGVPELNDELCAPDGEPPGGSEYGAKGCWI